MRVLPTRHLLTLVLSLTVGLSITTAEGQSTGSATSVKQPSHAAPGGVPAAPAASAVGRNLEREVQPAPKPTRKAAPRSRLATSEEATPRKQSRSNSQKRKNDANRKREALAKQQAEERRDAEERARLKAERIDELLARAKRNYAEGQLIEPASNNAALHYREVLTLEPNQLEALAGAQRIVDILAAEAERTAAAGDRQRTRQYIAQIRSLRPDDDSLRELDARLKALNESPVVLSARQQDRYDRSAQSIERATEMLKTAPLDLRTLDAAVDEYDRAASLVELAPGLPMLRDRIILAFPAATKNELASDNSKRALRVVQMARQRGWLSPELELLESEAKENMATKRPL